MRTLPIHMMSDMFHSMTELHHVDACIPLKARPSAASTPACAQLMAHLCVVFANNPFDRDPPPHPMESKHLDLGESWRAGEGQHIGNKEPQSPIWLEHAGGDSGASCMHQVPTIPRA